MARNITANRMCHCACFPEPKTTTLAVSLRDWYRSVDPRAVRKDVSSAALSMPTASPAALHKVRTLRSAGGGGCAASEAALVGPEGGAMLTILTPIACGVGAGINKLLRPLGRDITERSG